MADLAEQVTHSAEHALSEAQRTAWRARVPARIERQRGRLFLIVAASALIGYLSLLLIVRSNREIRADIETTLLFQRRSHPILSRVMDLVSWIGFRPQSLMLPGTVVIGSWLLRFRLESFFLMAAWSSSFISFFTKLLVRRPRPTSGLVRVVEANLRDTSFPSGHTLHYVTFWGFFTYLTFATVRNRAVRLLSVAVFGPLIALVGPSRIYLGHHWLTDVLASYLLGIAYLIGLVSVYRWLKGISGP